MASGVAYDLRFKLSNVNYLGSLQEHVPRLLLHKIGTPLPFHPSLSCQEEPYTSVAHLQKSQKAKKGAARVNSTITLSKFQTERMDRMHFL